MKNVHTHSVHQQHIHYKLIPWWTKQVFIICNTYSSNFNTIIKISKTRGEFRYRKMFPGAKRDNAARYIVKLRKSTRSSVAAERQTRGRKKMSPKTPFRAAEYVCAHVTVEIRMCTDGEKLKFIYIQTSHSHRHLQGIVS